jgi:hypothetical protein
MTEEILFETKASNLIEALKQTSTTEINEVAGSAIYYRGLEYYKKGAVEELIFVSDDKIIAQVSGTEEYEIIIYLEDGNVVAECDCPYEEGVCKHTVAVLLQAKKALPISIVETIKKTDKFQTYLENLSKNELIDLVLKYAPEQFKELIRNKSLGTNEVMPEFLKIKKEIDNLLNNDDLYDSPDEFETELIANVSKLEAFFDKLPDEIWNLLLNIINEIDKLTDDGYLYDHYSDRCFEGDSLSEFILSFVKTLPFDKKLLRIQELLEFEKSSSYSTFNFQKLANSIYNPEDLPELKRYYLSELTNNTSTNNDSYYPALRPILSDDEKEFVLLRIKDSSTDFLYELAQLYISQNKYKEALSTLGQFVKSNQDTEKITSNIFKLYIELLAHQKLPLRETCQLALRKYLYHIDMLVFVINNDPQNKTEYEEFIKAKSLNVYFDFLVSEKRLEEANLLAVSGKIMSNSVYVFYCKYKAKFVDEACKCFLEIIQINLKDAGDRYYRKIDEALEQLSAIDGALAKENVARIRAEYKRRTNLMALLRKY